jgi:drug/metabolite transporter (DMT)-like permease
LTILLGLVAALLFGVGDLVAGVGGRRDGSSHAPAGIALTASSAGAVLSGLYLVFLSDDSFTGNDIWWALTAAISLSAARPLLYRGMSIGPIVAFAPVFGLVALVVPSLLGTMAGQVLAGAEVAGVIVAIPAVVLLSSGERIPRPTELWSSSVLWNASAVGLLVGLGGLFLSLVSDDAGVAPAFAVTLVGIVVIPLVCRQVGLTPRLNRTTAGFGMLVGCTSIIAGMLAAVTYQRSSAAIGSVLIGLSPGVSILLAWRFVGERVWPLQIVGGLLGGLAVVLFTLAP